MTRFDLDLAVCRPGGGYDPDLWFPVSLPHTPQGRKDRAVPVALCRTCPVREACLADALERNEQHGVWGALTEAERRALRKARRLNADAA